MQLISAVNKFIKDHRLFSKEDRILLAVSGGLDSMVMLSLLHESGYIVSVAHCNFSLRGKESDADALFVQEQCALLQISFFSECFDTSAYADEKSISVQMAARDLRYEWFEELCTVNNFTNICTAHHADDNAETVLLNLTRGTGITGLTGIPLRNGKTVRPLLNFSRNDLSAYAQSKRIKWREDSSNGSIDYQRNLIRHKVIPVLKQLNPSLDETLTDFSRIMKENEEMIALQVAAEIQTLQDAKHGTVFLNTKTLKEHSSFNSILFHFLSDYDFHSSIIPDIAQAIRQNLSGRNFFSKKFRVLTDRDQIIITSLQYMEEQPDILVEAGLTVISLPDGLLRMQIIDPEPETMFRNQDSNKAFLDTTHLKFPLRCRRWIKGDYFYPLGMEHRQKLSDYFIDHKVPVYMKEMSWLLMNEDDIAWVIGHRIDQRYRLTENTEKVLALEWRSHGTANAL